MMRTTIAFLFLLVSCKTAVVSQQTPNNERAIAFPGAEGFGKYTTGGRGGKIYKVTNLNDAGPGSFRAAAEAKGKRYIVFDVDGTIHLETKISIKGDVTILGQTAPGDGVCLADQPVSLGGDNIIVRYLRIRMGDKFQHAEKIDGAGGDDAFGGNRHKNIIVDHCSISWSTDEVFSMYSGDSTTLQWNMIAEPLNYSYHFETGDTDFEHHGYGGIWGGTHLSAHHNIFAHCNSRTPRFNGIRTSPKEMVDFRNNVIYNWGINNVYAGEGGEYNVVNNYYKPGINTNARVRSRIVNPGRTKEIGFGKWYVDGNYVEGFNDVSRNNATGVTLSNDAVPGDKEATLITKPLPAVALPEQSAKDAFRYSLFWSGASFKRDTLDARIVNDIENGTGHLIDVQGGYPHGTTYEKTIAAWPYLKQVLPAADADADGIPDAWERAHGLSANNAADATQMKDNTHYTHLEWYANSLLELK